MAKSALPILALAGVAAFILMPKKKKSVGAPPSADSDIVDSGSASGWDWQVRALKATPGFADQWVGEVRKVGAKSWIGQTPRTSPHEAKMLALEFIASQQSEEALPSVDSIVDFGSEAGWEWRVRHILIDNSTKTAYVGDVRGVDATDWVSVRAPAATLVIARGYALDFIASQQ